MKIDSKTLRKIENAQKSEITEYFVYISLSKIVKGEDNKEILKHIAKDEYNHYMFWKGFTKKSPKPSKWNIFKYTLFARLFGLTFTVKLMEKGESRAQLNYTELSKIIPEASKIIDDEHKHEQELINLIDEDKLKYTGSVVLGLNDALVELTGVLAGFTLALQQSKLIAMLGIITGISASFSMAASEYLSTKSEDNGKNPKKASLYTGIAYLLTVFVLVFPYLLFANVYYSLGLTIFLAIVIIFVFNLYISVAKDLSFRKRFLEMLVISLGVATLSFFVGFVVRGLFNITI